MTHIRMKPADRKAQILAVAVKFAAKNGFKKMNRTVIAAGAGVTNGLVSRYFINLDGLHNEVVAEGIATKNVALLAHAVNERFDISTAPRQLQRDARAAAAKYA